MFLRGVKDLNAAPGLVAPTTETLTTDPEEEAVEPVAKELEPIKMREEVAALVPAGALAELAAKIVESDALQSVAKASSVTAEPPAISMPAAIPAPALPPLMPAIPAPTVPAPVKLALESSNGHKAIEPEAKEVERPQISEPVKPVEEKILESAPATPALSNERTVVPTQPPQRSEPVLPAPNGSSQQSEPMNKTNNPQFDTLVLDVAHIIFGDNAPEINVRLVRMALEQVWQNRAELQSLDAIAKEIARIIFGETNTSDLNVRLVKMALERSNSIALFKAA
jgi:hypothetical protein